MFMATFIIFIEINGCNYKYTLLYMLRDNDSSLIKLNLYYLFSYFSYLLFSVTFEFLLDTKMRQL